MKRTRALALICFILTIGLFTGCRDSNTNNTHESIFPARYTAYRNSYSFTGYTIEENGAEGVAITMFGNGYSKIAFQFDKGALMPAYCEAEADGETYAADSIENSADWLKFIFNTPFTPEMIKLTNADTDELIVSFNVSDEPQQES